MRGSYLTSASRTRCTTSAMVRALFGANTRSWMPQPKSGSIGRSPGAVARISRIDSSMRCSSRACAIRPFGVTCSGNFQPMPRKRRSGACVSMGASREPDFGAAADGRVAGCARSRRRRRSRRVCAGRRRQMDFARSTAAAPLRERVAARVAIRDLDLEARQRADFDVARGLHRSRSSACMRALCAASGLVSGVSNVDGVAAVRGRRRRR